ncbi:MAG: cytochrome P450 [bacterium]|nr:cytochrome P450 [Deltaproteobacteria bacterium]MCP4903837.1 cytochrome P450 [bacterium]
MTQRPFQTIDEMMAAGPNAAIEDPYSLYARARRETPVLEVAGFGSPARFLMRFEDVQSALRDWETFSSVSNGERGIAIVIGRTIIGMDGREHLRNRALVTPAVAPRALRGDFPAMVRRIADELIDRFAGKGSAELVRNFTYLFPIRVFVEPLGLPAADIERFHNWAIDLTQVANDPPRGLAASAAIREYLKPIIAAKRSEPADDIISTLVTSEVEGERLGDEHIANFLCLLIMAGAETTYHLIGSTLYALLTHGAALEEVRAHRDRIPLAVAETLRWESPVQVVTREAQADVEMSGVLIKKGTDVVIGIGSANRDESQFEDPDRFDLHREGAEHIAFGFGRHYCAGSRLALLEAEIGLGALFERLPNLRMDEGAEPGNMSGFAFRSPTSLPVVFD